MGPSPDRTAADRCRVAARRLVAGLVVGLVAACGGSGTVPAPAPSGEVPPGNWKRAREARTPTAEQQAAIEALEAVGYTAGSRPAVDRSGGVTVLDRGSAHDGVNLYVSGHGPEAVLMDMEGRVLHRWSRRFEDIWPDRDVPEHNTQRHFYRRAHLLPDGRLLVLFEGLGLAALDRRSEVVWAFDGAAHHDLDVHPDGRVAVLTRTARLVPALHPVRPVLEDAVTWLDPDGRELESVSIRECVLHSPYADLFAHHRERFERSGYAFVEGTVGGNLWGDLYHTNTLERLDGSRDDPLGLDAPGRFLVSMRNLDLIAVLDLPRRTVVWAAAGSWRSQHQPSLLPNGNILLFDNRGTPRRSRVLELDPASGETVWSYQADEPDVFFSAASGSCQRLGNGNTLVTESNAGRAFEVTPEARIVWEFLSPHRAGPGGELVANLFEVVRLPRSHVAGWLDP